MYTKEQLIGRRFIAPLGPHPYIIDNHIQSNKVMVTWNKSDGHSYNGMSSYDVSEVNKFINTTKDWKLIPYTKDDLKVGFRFKGGIYEYTIKATRFEDNIVFTSFKNMPDSNEPMSISYLLDLLNKGDWKVLPPIVNTTEAPTKANFKEGEVYENRNGSTIIITKIGFYTAEYTYVNSNDIVTTGEQSISIINEHIKYHRWQLNPNLKAVTKLVDNSSVITSFEKAIKFNEMNKSIKPFYHQSEFETKVGRKTEKRHLTLCAIVVNNGDIHVGHAIQNPDDKFDIEIGKKIALGRADIKAIRIFPVVDSIFHNKKIKQALLEIIALDIARHPENYIATVKKRLTSRSKRVPVGRG